MKPVVRALGLALTLSGITAGAFLLLAPEGKAQATPLPTVVTGPAPVRLPRALFDARDVVQERFVLVAAPIGKGERAQLNIYEQIANKRSCFAVGSGLPASVNPLLGSFDFTGHCNRFIDGNGYSVRVGGSDLGTVYRLSVLRQANDTILVASPTRPNVGPEMLVARTGGAGSGFLLLVPEPGWKLMRRHYGSRSLGHVYVYRDSWPLEAVTQVPQPAAVPSLNPPVPPPKPAS